VNSNKIKNKIANKYPDKANPSPNINEIKKVKLTSSGIAFESNNP